MSSARISDGLTQQWWHVRHGVSSWPPCWKLMYCSLRVHRHWRRFVRCVSDCVAGIVSMTAYTLICRCVNVWLMCWCWCVDLTCSRWCTDQHIDTSAHQHSKHSKSTRAYETQETQQHSHQLHQHIRYSISPPAVYLQPSHQTLVNQVRARCGAIVDRSTSHRSQIIENVHWTHTHTTT